MTNARPTPRRLRAGRLLLAAALALPGALFAQEAADAGKDYVIEAAFGGQYRSDPAGRYARFEQYREVPQGDVVESLRLLWTPKSKPWTVSFDARDVRQIDQQYFLDVNRPGKLRFKVSYSETPHFFSNGATFLHGGAPGAYTLSSTLRQALESAAVASPPSVASLVPGVVADGRRIDLRLKRDEAKGELTWTLGHGWDLTLRSRHEERSGTRALSTGTYIRRQAITGQPGTGPGFFDRERIEGRGLELPEPIDYRTLELGVAAGYTRKGFSAGAGFDYSRFENRVGTLFWENPFEAPGSVASSTIGLAPQFDQEPGAPAGNSGNRGRFAQAALDLWPDNRYARFHANASVKLPGQSRLSAVVAVARLEQDDELLPYTLNEAVLFADPNVLARDVAPPVARLDGEVHTTRADLRFVSHPTRPLNLRAAFRLYKYDNRTPQIFFPGYAAAGESYFRRNIGERDAAGNKILPSRVPAYDRWVGSLGASYRFAERLTLEAGYARTRWDYDERQVDKTDEDTLELSARLRPRDGVTLRLAWLDGSRDFSGPYTVGLEASGIRAWDVWTRYRTRVAAEADVEVGERWTASGAFSHLEDEYPGAVQGFAQPYGLQDTRLDSVSGTLTYGADKWALSLSAGFDSSEWNSLQVTKTSLTNDTIQYDPVNRWTRGQGDDNWWVGLSVQAEAAKKLRLSADLGYNRYTGDWVTTNLATPTINSAVAYAFPQFKERLFTSRVSLTYALNARVDLEGRYSYEPYRLDDFTWDSLQPYMQGVIQETGGSPSALRAGNVNRLLWLDNRYSDYTFHVVSALLHVRF